MAGEKPGFEWDVPEDRDADAAVRAARMDPPAPRPPETAGVSVIHEGEDAARVIYGEVCAICRDDVTRRGRIDACDHLFCLPCIKRWAKIETKCPLCKARFSFIQPEDLVPPDPASRPSTRGARAGDPQKELKRIYLPHRDQVYEGDGELPDGMDIEEVLCGRCGDGGDEDKLMLCDGCDQGFHCYCVGLDSVPMDEWRCVICAVEDEDEDDGDVATDDGIERRRESASGEDESTRRDEAIARGEFILIFVWAIRMTCFFCLQGCREPKTRRRREPSETSSSQPRGNGRRCFVTHGVTHGVTHTAATTFACARWSPIAGRASDARTRPTRPRRTRTRMTVRRRGLALFDPRGNRTLDRGGHRRPRTVPQGARTRDDVRRLRASRSFGGCGSGTGRARSRSATATIPFKSTIRHDRTA